MEPILGWIAYYILGEFFNYVVTKSMDKYIAEASLLDVDGDHTHPLWIAHQERVSLGLGYSAYHRMYQQAEVYAEVMTKKDDYTGNTIQLWFKYAYLIRQMVCAMFLGHGSN
jgi:hypothetical protein